MSRAKGCAGVTMYRMYGLERLLQFRHSRHPWRSYVAAAWIQRSGDLQDVRHKVAPRLCLLSRYTSNFHAVAT